MNNVQKDRPAGFFSREQQLAQLSEILSASRNGEGSICLYEGEAGIGKTRLLDEAGAVAREKEFAVLRGRCFEEEGIPPLWPWIEIVREIAELAGWDTVRRSAGAAYTSLRSYLPEIAQPADDDTSAGGPISETERDAGFECGYSIFRLLKHVSSKTPLLLSLDDIQWADEKSLRVLTFIARNLSELPLAMLVTSRVNPGGPTGPNDAIIGDLSRLPYFERVTLRGLTKSDVGICATQISRREVSDHVCESIFAATDGNPLLVVQLAGALSGGKAAISVEEIEETGLLRGLSSVVGRSLARVSAKTKQILETASLIGSEFSLRLFIETGLAESADIGIAAFDEAAAASIVVPVDGRTDEFRFCHDLVRRAVAEGLYAGSRMRRHADIAVRLEEWWHEDLDCHAGELYYHFLQAGPLVAKSKAAEYAWRAGKTAMQASFYADARSYFAKGIELTEAEDLSDLHANLLADGGIALLSAGSGGYNYGKGIQQLSEAFRYFDSVGDRESIAMRALHRRLYGLTTYFGEESRECIDLCLSNTDPGTRSHDYARALAACYRLSESDSGEADPDRLPAVQRIVEQADDIDLKIRVIEFLASHSFEMGRIEESLDHLLRLEGVVTQSPDSSILLRFDAIIAIANRQLHLEMYDEAKSANTRATALAEQSGRPDLLVWARMSELEIIQYADNDLDRELELEEEVGRLGEQLGFPGRDLSARYFCVMATGPRSELHALLDEIADEIAKLKAVLIYPIALANYLLLTGDTTWIGSLETACRGFLSSVWITSRGRFAHIFNTGLAAAYVYRGEVEKAAELYHGIVPRVVDYGYLHIGLIAWKLGLLDEAIGHLARSLDCPGRLSVWARLKLGRVLIQRNQNNDRGRGIAYIAEALDLARRHGLAMIEEEADAMLAELDLAGTKPKAAAGLSPREIEVLSCIAVGKIDKEIAAELDIAVSTVSNHVRNIFQKTGAENRTEAAVFALKKGLVG